ncbi:MAG: microcompartment protein CcmK/EutM [Myxococcota bacterium]|jgi:microcompartment protein CcmK/EutM
MKLGRIVGTVVSTHKDEKIDGLILYVVRDLSLSIAEKDSFVVAVDSVGSGLGEVVLYASGSAARQTHVTDGRPVDAVVMAIVDQMDVHGRLVYNKSDDTGVSSAPAEE